MRKINTRAELIELARELGMRQDWHEPDEQNVTAYVTGRELSFDNAMGGGDERELHVVLCEHVVENGVARRGRDIAVVNLATLFAWATGYESPSSLDLEGIAITLQMVGRDVRRAIEARRT